MNQACPSRFLAWRMTFKTSALKEILSTHRQKTQLFYFIWCQCVISFKCILKIFAYIQVLKRRRFMTRIHLAQTCSCSLMRAGILTRTWVPPIPCSLLPSSRLLLIWPRRRTTFAFLKPLTPKERLGNAHPPCKGLRNALRFSLCCFTVSRVFQNRDQEPVVKHLTSGPVEIKDNHFSQPLGSDSSRAALNFPIPEVRYLIREISVIWHLYGGKDFGSAVCAASPARSRGWVKSLDFLFKLAQKESDF